MESCLDLNLSTVEKLLLLETQEGIAFSTHILFFLGFIKVIKVTSTHCTGHLTETVGIFSRFPRGPMSHSYL